MVKGNGPENCEQEPWCFVAGMDIEQIAKMVERIPSLSCVYLLSVCNKDVLGNNDRRGTEV